MLLVGQKWHTSHLISATQICQTNLNLCYPSTSQLLCCYGSVRQRGVFKWLLGCVRVLCLKVSKVYRRTDVWRMLAQIKTRSGWLCHSICNINIIMSVSVQWEGTDRTHPTCPVCLGAGGLLWEIKFPTHSPHYNGAHINTADVSHVI